MRNLCLRLIIARMFRAAIIISCSISLRSLEAQIANEGDGASFAPWLGPQSITSAEIVTSTSPSLPKISLAVVNGEKLHLPEEILEVTTCRNGRIIAAKRPVVEKDKLYVVGAVAFEPSGKQPVVDQLSVRVAQGPLQDAIIHFRPGKLSRLPSEQYWAVYEIPSELNIAASPLEFTIINQKIRDFSIEACRAETAEWLGPQNKKAAIPKSLVDRILPGVEIEASIVSGAELRLPESENGIVVLADQKLLAVESFTPDRSRQYLFAKLSGEGGIGRAIYDLDIVVTAGELTGAVVHFRDGDIPESLSDPLVALFEVPADLNLLESNIPFEVIRVLEK